jgi:hypothetical protein
MAIGNNIAKIIFSGMPVVGVYTFGIKFLG